MKTALIYYSYEGNSALIAEAIKAGFAVDVFEIKTANTKKRKGFAKYFWGGAQVFFGRKPALLPLSVDVNAYDIIILGTPVWAGSPAPALVSFLSKTAITGKKLALFCCYAGNKGKVFDKIKSLLPGNTVVGEIGFQNPASQEKAALKQKVNEWLKTFN